MSSYFRQSVQNHSILFKKENYHCKFMPGIITSNLIGTEKVRILGEKIFFITAG